MNATDPDLWKRREAAFAVGLPYVMLAATTLGTAIAAWDTATIAIAVAAGAWLRWHPRRPLVFFAVLQLLSAALVVLAPWYGFFAFTAYFSIDRLPERARMPGAIVVATIVGTSQAGGVPSGSVSTYLVWAAVVAVNIGVVCALMAFAFATDEQREERERAIAELTEANRRLELTLRENAGLHAQLVTQAREAAILDERQRMAREIHDTLAQGLTGIITQLEAAAETPDDGWRRHHETAARLARESLTEARRSVHALRPEPLTSAGLPEALVNVARGWSELHRVEAQVTTTGDARPMRPEIEVALLRTAQEALTNVAKHARASRVGVTLSYMDEQVTLDVRDDGVGFAEPGGGFGLLGMRERLAELAGTLEVESDPGAGTAISATMPAR